MRFALALHVVEKRPDGIREGQDARRDPGKLGDEVLRLHLRLAHAAAQRIVVGEQSFHLGANGGKIGQVIHADGAAAHLVLIGGADAAAGGADLARARGRLAELVEFAVQGQDEGGVPAMRRLARETSTPCEESLSISAASAHGSITTPLPMTESLPGRTMPGWQQRELVGDAVDHQRVAGIVPALEAHHHIGPLGQPVHQLALALVAPLGADHRHIRHFRLLIRHRNGPGAQSRRGRLGLIHDQARKANRDLAHPKTG
jgi:hypothetical protein